MELVYRFCRLGLAFTYRRTTGDKRFGTDFTVHARSPDAWPSFSIAYQYGESHYQIRVSRSNAEYRVTLDGVLLPDDRIPLRDDGQNHTVEIIQN